MATLEDFISNLSNQKKMTSKENLHFIQFIEERRSMASSPDTKTAYTIIKEAYIKIHTPNLIVVDIDFKLIKKIKGKLYKIGEVFSSYMGLVSGINEIDFKNTEYFEPVNLKYKKKKFKLSLTNKMPV